MVAAGLENGNFDRQLLVAGVAHWVVGADAAVRRAPRGCTVGGRAPDQVHDILWRGGSVHRHLYREKSSRRADGPILHFLWLQLEGFARRLSVPGVRPW